MSFFSRAVRQITGHYQQQVGQLFQTVAPFIAVADPVGGLLAGGTGQALIQLGQRNAGNSRLASGGAPNLQPVVDVGNQILDPGPAQLVPSGGGSGGGIPVGSLVQLGQGIAQQTPAVRHLAAKASGRMGGLRSARKRRAKKKTVAARRSKRRSIARPARLVKGSAAAKRYMASIRKKRRK